MGNGYNRAGNIGIVSMTITITVLAVIRHYLTKYSINGKE
jgi:hypothetical protein